MNNQKHLLPDTLRPTELHGFGDLFTSSHKLARRTIVALLAVIALLSVGYEITSGTAGPQKNLEISAVVK